MSVSTTIKPKMILDKWLSPSVAARLKPAFAEVREVQPKVEGYVGTDGERMFFQVFGDPTYYSTLLFSTPSDDHFA